MDFCPSGKEMCANSLKYMHYVKASKVVCETLSRRRMGDFFPYQWKSIFAQQYKIPGKMCLNHQVITMNKLTPYDPAAALVNDEAIALFMADALETGDAAYIARALGVIARAKGMTDIAAETGLSREQLYRSFSEKGNPTLKTTLSVMKALGIELTVKR